MASSTAEAKQFLRSLDPNATWFTFQTFTDLEQKPFPDSLARVLNVNRFTPDLLDLYEQGAGVWITINDSDGNGRKASAIRRVRSVWQEDDSGHEGAFPLDPSLVVQSSPGRHHRYWLVDGAWPADEQGRRDFDGVMARMIADYGSDPGAKDISRVLRVPGFLHRKDPNDPHMVRVVGGNGQRYTRAQILAAFPPPEKTSARRGNGNGHAGSGYSESHAELVRQVLTSENYHGALLSLAWRHVGAGMPAKQVEEHLRGLMLAIPEERHDERWHARYDEIPRLVSSAEAKQADARPDDDAEWPEPDWSLLDDRRGVLPDFPLEALTKPWQTWLQKAAHGAGVTPAHVVVPLLAIASGLVGTARRVRASRSWCEPFPNWTAVIGFSGDGKTPGLDVPRRALSLIARNRKHKLGELQREHETRVETAKAAAKKWKAEVQEAVEAGGKAPDMPAQAVSPGVFVAPRLYVSDSTIERLATLVEARPRGTLMIADELARLFLNMGRYSNGSDKEFWLEAWNGGSYVQERQSRPPVVVDYLIVGMTGGFQPDKLARSFAGDDDGMYARILFAWPPPADYKPLSNNVADVEPEFQTALMRLIDLIDMDGETFTPKDVWLSDEAKDTFEHFRQFLHAGKTALEGREREWWAKGATHVLRLAGTLCYLDWAMREALSGLSALSDTHPRHGPEEIGPGFVAAAVKLWRDYFWPHACAALRQVGISEQHANARRVLLWAQANGKAEVSLMDARRGALKQQLDAEQTESLLDRLVKAGWLKKATEKTGGRARHRWTVNSQLLSSGGVQEVQEVQKGWERQEG